MTQHVRLLMIVTLVGPLPASQPLDAQSITSRNEAPESLAPSPVPLRGKRVVA